VGFSTRDCGPREVSEDGCVLVRPDMQHRVAGRNGMADDPAAEPLDRDEPHSSAADLERGYSTLAAVHLPKRIGESVRWRAPSGSPKIERDAAVLGRTPRRPR